MQIVVSDSSCLIDLRKASLLTDFLSLPYRITIPNTLFEDELLKFPGEQKVEMLRLGLNVVDLPGGVVIRAQQVNEVLPQLSIHDSLAFAFAESNPGSLLLTGDGALRKFAEERELLVRGVLWVIDELYDRQVSDAKDLVDALRLFTSDTTVRLPRSLLATYMKRYERLAK